MQSRSLNFVLQFFVILMGNRQEKKLQNWSEIVKGISEHKKTKQKVKRQNEQQNYGQRHDGCKRLLQGNYWKQVTSDYQLHLEVDKQTLLIQLDTRKGKSFRKIICDTGEMKSKLEYIKVQQIFELIKENCIINHKKGILSYAISKQIDLKQVRLVGRMKEKVRASSVKNNFKSLEKEELKDLIDKTSDLNHFWIQNNTFTKKTESGAWSKLFLNVSITKEIFSLQTHINSLQKNEISMGVIQKTKGEQNNSPAQIIEYSSQIRYPGKDQSLWGKDLDSFDFLNAGMDILMEIDSIKCLVTFILDGESVNKFTKKTKKGRRKYQAHVPILGQSELKFIPFYAVKNKGDSITWSIH